MAFRRGRYAGRTSRRWLLVRLALAAAVAVLIFARYTSPRSIFDPVATTEPASQRR